MDNLPEGPAGRAPSYRFGPDGRLTALAAALAVAAAGLAVATGDAAGRLLFAVAAGVLIAYAATDLIFRPRLAASAEGLVIRAPGGSGRFAWAEVEAVRAATVPHLGLRTVTLEIDAGGRLFVLSRRALGADPAEAAGLVLAFAPPGGPGGPGGPAAGPA